MTEPAKPRICLVEDEAIVLADIVIRLTQMGYEVVGSATRGEEVVALAQRLRPDLVLMDIHLQGAMDGITAARELRDRLHLPVVFLTAYGEDATVQRAKEAEPFGYVLKPIEDRELRIVIEMALYKHRVERKLLMFNTELEQRVAVRTAELEATNKELESFCYSVSHDLRAPLRAVNGYTGILVDDYAAGLDAEGQRVCAVIHQGAQDMGRLIDDLLAFSRIGRSSMDLSTVDMATLARSIFFEVTSPEERGRIDFQVGCLPSILGDPPLLRQVWTNLLANAVKFSSGRPQAVIEVNAEESADEMIYWVRDNGAGFDMRFAHKLFGVFQRLHSVKEFEGTGVGLAIVRRVVERHGGRTWAEGEPGRGATVYFSLRKPLQPWNL
jgi:signal transduction histidine kinase